MRHAKMRAGLCSRRSRSPRSTEQKTMATSDLNTGSRPVSQPTSAAMYDATRKRRRNKHRKTEHSAGEVKDLNITPMLDMMTILLVFLLKSFASSSQDVNV